MSVRVLVVDDHPVFRDGLGALVASAEDLVLAGTAASGDEAVGLAGTGVDVVLMDLNMPGMSGIEATSAIAQLADAPAVLVVTMVDDDDTVAAAMRAGARGYVLKGATGAEILIAIRAVATGGAVLGAGLATALLHPTSSRSAAPDGVGELTAREREILEHLSRGQSNKQIARELDLSLKTVQNYVSRLLDKLQVSDRTQAALLGRDHRAP